MRPCATISAQLQMRFQAKRLTAIKPQVDMAQSTNWLLIAKPLVNICFNCWLSGGQTGMRCVCALVNVISTGMIFSWLSKIIIR